jgi:hypothetical protein
MPAGSLGITMAVPTAAAPRARRAPRRTRDYAGWRSTAGRRHVQVGNSLLQVRRDVVPVEVQIAFDQVDRGGIAKLTIETELLELVEESVADLVHHTLLHDDSWKEDWARWLSKAGVRKVSPA